MTAVMGQLTDDEKMWLSHSLDDAMLAGANIVGKQLRDKQSDWDWLSSNLNAIRKQFLDGKTTSLLQMEANQRKGK